MTELKKESSKTQAYKKSICAWCNEVIGIFPIENDIDIVSHGICLSCFEAISKKVDIK